eukprot:9229883-Pyramimonas_sp.AAC.1
MSVYMFCREFSSHEILGTGTRAPGTETQASPTGKHVRAQRACFCLVKASPRARLFQNRLCNPCVVRESGFLRNGIGRADVALLGGVCHLQRAELRVHHAPEPVPSEGAPLLAVLGLLAALGLLAPLGRLGVLDVGLRRRDS